MLLRLIVVGTFILSPIFVRSYAEAPRIEIIDSVPDLSVDTLYHPKNRFKYVESPTPAIRWINDGSDVPTLIVKRDDGWKQVALANGEETPCTIVAVYAPMLRKLEGVDEKRASSAVSHWLSNTDQASDTALVTIDDSIALVGINQPARWVSRAAKTWREISLSPDSKQIAYVETNDLYVMHLASGRVTRITDDGSPTKLNGILDWVYQEEIYGRGNYRGYWWRDDSAAISFLRLDTSAVAEYSITDSKEPKGRTLVERYPKAGDAIPSVELWCAKIDGTSIDSVPILKPLLQDSLAPDTLITRVGWHEQTGQALVQTSNRIQNDVSLHLIDVDNPARVNILVREQTDKWLEVHELPKVLKNGDYVRLSDLPAGRRRLWKMSADGASRIPLTPDDFDVRELLFVDDDGNYAIVTGDRLRNTIGQQLYRVDLVSVSAPMRLTDESPWHAVSISHDGKWMVDRVSSLSTPTTASLRSLIDKDKPAILIHQERLKLKRVPMQTSWHSIPAKNGVTLPAYVIRPSSEDSAADESPAKKYPVLIEIYGGPLAPSVRDAWSSGRYLFHQMLAQEGIAVMVVDNRSSGGRGLADSWTIHRRMGEVETKDMVAAAEWLGRQHWVDAKRIAIRGWSFGGFLTLHAMTHSDKFIAGVAGGSVTDWRNYDAVYTERFMGLPADNKAGYDATSPKLAASKMHGRVLMLHGEVDDNVHLANTLQMANELQRAGKPFEMMIYPGAAHAVHAPDQNYHLMMMTMEFLRGELLARD